MGGVLRVHRFLRFRLLRQPRNLSAFLISSARRVSCSRFASASHSSRISQTVRPVRAASRFAASVSELWLL
jgi:DNA-directed RNA polymerase specialized sigma24 family protein